MKALHPMASDSARTRLRETIAAIERRSAVEIVLAVRPASDRWLDVDLLVGAAVAWLALVLTLFSETEFDLDAIAVVVPAAGLAAGLLSRLAPPVRMAIAGARRIEAAVLRAARACFVESRVSYTRGRTGVLVYVSLLERRVVVIADAGVDRAVEAVRPEWDAAVRGLSEVAQRSGLRDPEDFARALAAFESLFERVLPRSTDDLDELPDFADM